MLPGPIAVDAPERQTAVINPQEERLTPNLGQQEREQELQPGNSASEMVMRAVLTLDAG